MMREALAEALVVSGETGSRAVTRAIGGPKAVNQALKSGLLVVSGLQPPEGSEHLSTKPDAPYLHGWTNAEETATTFAALLREDGFAARALTFGNGTSGIRREIDPVWGDNWRPAGSQHPADVLMAELDQLIAIDPSGPEATARLGRLLDPDWQPSAFPNKVAADNDRKIGILSLHDVCQVGELVVASLVSLGFGEEPDFPLDNNHPAYNFHASVGELVAAA